MKYLELANVEDKKEALKNELITFQKLFLKCLEVRANNAESKKEIIDLMYRFRYYCLLPANQENSIFQIEELEENLHDAGIAIINKAKSIKVIAQFSENEETNYKILKNIFTVRIMKLEELYIKITKEKDKYFVQVFDEDVFEQKVQLPIDINKKEIKINKKVKLFE
jgi:hypothetical protein